MFKISLNVFFWPLCKHEAIYWSHYCFTLQKLGKSIRILLQNALHTVVWSSGPKKIPWLHNLSGAVLWHRNLALPEDTTASLLWDRNLRLWSQILNHCKPTVPLSALSVSSNPCLSPGFPAFFPTWISICPSPLPCNDSHLSLPSISPLFYFSTSLPGLYSPFFSSLFLALPTPWTDMDVPLSIAVISANCLDRVKEFSSLSFYCKQPLNTRSSISKYRCTAGWVHIDYHDTSNSRNDK